MANPRTGLRIQVSFSDKPPLSAPEVRACEKDVPSSAPKSPEPVGETFGRASSSPDTRVVFGSAPRPPALVARRLPVEGFRPRASTLAPRLKPFAAPRSAAPTRPARPRAPAPMREPLALRALEFPTDAVLAVVGPALKETSHLVEWAAITLGVGSMLLDHPLICVSAVRLAGAFGARVVSNHRFAPDPWVAIDRAFDMDNSDMKDELTVGGPLQLDGRRVLGMIVPVTAVAQAAGHLGDYLTHRAKREQENRVRARTARAEETARRRGELMRPAAEWKIKLLAGLGAVLSRMGQALTLVTVEALGLKKGLEKKRLDVRVSRAVSIPGGKDVARHALPLGFAAEVRAEADFSAETSVASNHQPEGLARLSGPASLKGGRALGVGLFVLGRMLSHKARELRIERRLIERRP